MKTASSNTRHLSVRLLMATAAAVLLTGGRSVQTVQPPTGSPCGATINAIQCENQLTGNPASEWDITGAGDPSIQGFATEISVDKSAEAPANRTVVFKISTTASAYAMDIYRLGYYGGMGARKVATVQPSAVLPQSQPNCLFDGGSGLLDCGNWAISASWVMPQDAASGIYIAKLTRPDTGGASHIVFIVRDDARQSDVIVQTSDTTWQAYNDYGGNSLYTGGQTAPGVNPAVYGSARRAYKVSYNRPITTRGPNPQSAVFSSEYPMVRWLEANGYDVKYWAGVDTDRRGSELIGARRPKIFMSSGHDEYWSGGQRANVEAARDAGVNLTFFSGNELFWKTRWEPSIDGSATSYRTLVSYKETLANAKIDPDPTWTGAWRDARFSPPSDGARPENALTGSMWSVNCCSYAIAVPAAMGQTRFWRNTRVATLAPGAVATLSTESLGYEWDESIDNGLLPVGLVRLSSTTAAVQEKVIDYGSTIGPGEATHSLTLYRAASGALVFGAGTVQWAWGLDGVHDRGSPAAHVTDVAMQQATVNLFADMGVQPATLQPLLTAATPTTDVFAPTSMVSSPIPGGSVGLGSRVTVSGTASDAGGGSVAAVEVSIDGGATWHPAQGSVNWKYDWSPAALGQTIVQSRAIDDSGNVETPSMGVTVTVGAGNCPCTTLWPPSAVPAVLDTQDANPVELGVKFRSDIDAQIAGLRFYKSAGNTGTHVGHLWTGTGALLATATFTNETASGWQQVMFSAPVAIAANTTYVASYHTNVGHYSITKGYFGSLGVDAPPLHAPSTGAGNGNGVFSYGAAAFPTTTYQAANYWVDVVRQQSVVDVTPPVLSSSDARIIDSSTMLVAWTTDENATSLVEYSTNAAFASGSTLNVTDAALVSSHSLTVSGLNARTTYYYRVTSADAAGNTSTSAVGTFTTPSATFRDTLASDFAAGTTAGTYVSETVDGEVMLAPAIGSEFSGTTLQPGWSSVPWGAAGTSTLGGGRLLVDGALVGTCTIVPGNCLETPTYLPGHSLEFTATFSGDAFQNSGFGVTFATPPWAMFTTKGGGALWARTNGVLSTETALGTAFIGTPHLYRIDWNLTDVVYWVDGVQVASHPIIVAGPMRPLAASDYSVYGGNIVVDWMRMGPYVASGTFTSRVLDAQMMVDWRSIAWNGSAPGLTVSVRMGDTPTPDDGTWTGFQPVAQGDLNGRSRYIQYRAEFAGTGGQTPVLSEIVISSGSAPVAVDDAASTTNDASYVFPASGPGSLAFNDSDAGGAPLQIVAVTTPTTGSATLNADGSVTYTPAAAFVGTAYFTYTISNGYAIAIGTVTMTVTAPAPAANQAPGFVKGADQIVLEDAAAQTVNGWATAISAGPPAEAGQALNFIVSFTNTSLFSAPPSITATGALSFTPAPNANGSAIVTVRLHDDGGTSNGGSDTSAAQTFTITVLAVNDSPSFTKGTDQTPATSGSQTVVGFATGIATGPADEAGQAVNFIVSTTNGTLFSVPPAIAPNGTLTYSVAPGANGLATVSVQLRDNGGTANGGVDTCAPQMFTINVVARNSAPSFVKGANQTVLEDAGPRTVAAWATSISAGAVNEGGQTLNFIVTNSNSALFSAQPAIASDGTLSYTPAVNASGSATVTVRIHDDGGTANGGSDTSAAQTFTITVTPVNDAPGFVKGANQTVAGATAQTIAGWATGMSAGPADESAQTMTFIVSSSNAALFAAQPAVASNGTLTFTPAANASGAATITVQLRDNGGTANAGADTSAAQTFTIAVSARDITPPVLTLPANITAEATGPKGAPVSFTATARDAVDGPMPVLCRPFPGTTFPLGTTTVTCYTSDRNMNIASGTFKVTVVDNTAPGIQTVTPSLGSLSNPNHRMVAVSVAVTAVDLVDANPVCQVASVTSSEPVSGFGGGDLAPDWQVSGPLAVSLRAERSPSGRGRTYTLAVRCTDTSGNSSTKPATVFVPY